MSEQCSGCHSSCDDCNITELDCPVCGKQGLEVEYETVKSISKHLIKQQLDSYKHDQFYLCVSRNCKNGYFTKDGAKIPLNQLEVPVWFKHDKDEYIVCYCRRITLDDVQQAVNHVVEPTRQKVLQYLNKTDVMTDCLHNNPTGKCCTPLFDNAVKYCIKHKDS